MTFGGFTFASEVLLGRIAAFYGFPIPETERATSLADFMRARLPHNPTMGDRIRIEDIELVVREMIGEQIATIGLELEPRRPDERAPAGASRLRHESFWRRLPPGHSQHHVPLGQARTACGRQAVTSSIVWLSRLF